MYIEQEDEQTLHIFFHLLTNSAFKSNGIGYLVNR